jgi:hypothetical protein
MSAAIEAVDSDLTQDGTELMVVVTTELVGADVVVTTGLVAGAGAGAAALTTENTSKADDGGGEGAGLAAGPAAAKEATKDCVCVMKLSNGTFGSNEPKSSVALSVRPERVPWGLIDIGRGSR